MRKFSTNDKIFSNYQTAKIISDLLIWSDIIYDDNYIYDYNLL